MAIYPKEQLLLFPPGGGGLWRGRRTLYLPCLLIILLSCTPAAFYNKGEENVLIEKVPFFPQEKYQCGPASLAGVLNFWGEIISPEDIAQEIYSPAAKGTLNLDLLFYAQKRGLQAQQYRGSLADLKRNISAGIPLIVQVDYGFLIYEQTHFMVVIGYNDQGIIVNSGRERAKFIPISSFLKIWTKANYWTLRITPQ
ncbi:MAG: C39 family peptidase [Thermodesulfobacteriota bacterium]